MKNKLEITWLIIQIVSVCLAGYWGVTRWYLSDYQKMKPGFDGDITGLDGVPWDRNGCSIGAFWELQNTGEVPFKVENITYLVFGVKDNFSELKEGEERDRSLGNLLANAAYKSSVITLEKRKDTVTSGGSISRDILWQYKPDAKNSEMFQNHRIAISVSADIYNEFSWWCPICPRVSDKTTVITKLQKYCTSS